MAAQLSGQSLLPAFEPVPFPTSSSPTAPSSSSSSFRAAVSQNPPSPGASGKQGFFARHRSNSLHSSSQVSLKRQDQACPPLPLPPFPAHLMSQPSTPTQSVPSPLPSSALPSIKSISVPHHAKSGGKWVFACRVVPESVVSASSSAASSPMSRIGSLGKMSIAGSGEGGASEPHTVWRSWGEFADFSARLTTAFPTVEPTSPSASDDSSPLPSSFYRQIPRLSRKMTLFVTRSTLYQRQDELDLFVRRLFEMPDVVKKSDIVRDFFRMRESDMQSCSTATSASTIGGSDLEYNGLSRLDLDLTSPNATVRAASSGKGKKQRPALGVKHSTPDLRKLMLSDNDSIYDAPYQLSAGGPFQRPVGMSRNPTVDDVTMRTSKYSIASSSASSAATVTPASMGQSRLPSPLGSLMKKASSQSLRGQKVDTIAEKELPVPVPVPQPKAHKPLLRHFHSLQDLRGNKHKNELAPPMPLLPASVVMGKALTQPIAPKPQQVVAPPVRRTGSNGSYSGGNKAAPIRPRASSKGSTSSFEDAHSYALSNFRLGTNGRIDRVPDSAPPFMTGGRRPSFPRTTSAHTTRAAHGHGSHGNGHSPSPSTSSLTSSNGSSRPSFEMSRSYSSPSYAQSRRSSTDLSDASFMPATPPTPLHNEGEFAGGKYYLAEDGSLAQNNLVPLPPFFPVPPSMSSVAMQAAYSQDGLPHSPRVSSHSRKLSSESRLRAGSSASRYPLDPILGSPCNSTTPNATSRPQDRPTVTFKVLHPDSNVVLRLPRTGLSLEVLRNQIDRKFAMSSGIKLYGDNNELQWALSYSLARTSGDSPAPSELLLNEEDFVIALERTAHLEKIPLRIIN